MSKAKKLAKKIAKTAARAKQKVPAMQSAAFVKKGKGRWVRKDRKVTKPKGHPRAAFRVQRDLLAAFVRKHKGTEGAWDAVRGFMSRQTGVSVDTGEE